MRPGPLTKRMLRAPTVLYEFGLGRIFGYRFLLLTHRGRRSGKSYRTMLEVLNWNPDTGEAIVISGLGPHSSWYLNILADGAERVEIGRFHFAPQIREPEIEEAAEVLAGYQRRNRLAMPIIRVLLSRLAGFEYDGSERARRRLAAELPLVAFRPVSE